MIWEFTAMDESTLFIDLESVVAIGLERKPGRYDEVKSTMIHTEPRVFAVKEDMECVVDVWHKFERGVLESPMDIKAQGKDVSRAIAKIESGHGILSSRSASSFQVYEMGSKCNFIFFEAKGQLSDMNGFNLEWIASDEFNCTKKSDPERFKELTKGIDFKKWEYLLEKSSN